MVGAAQAVPGGCLSLTKAQFLQEHQRVLAVGQGLVILTDESVGPADVAERDGLPDRVAGEAECVQGPAGVRQSVREAVLVRGKFGHPEADIRLAAEITGCREGLQGAPVMGFGLLQTVQPLARLGQAE